MMIFYCNDERRVYMAKLNLVIADEDSNYLNRLVNYITENDKQFEISSFSDKYSLFRHLSEPTNKIHILLFSENMASKELENCHVDVKLLLSDGEYTQNDKYKAINKYCRADVLIETLLVEYAEQSGHMDVLMSGNEEETLVIGVYSPVGGSGKTVLSLAMAKAFAAMEKEVLYLNFEGISSVGEILRNDSKWNMSDVYLETQNRKSNVGLKVVHCKESHYESGIYFINPPERATEYTEVKPSELARIINETKKVGKFDIIIVDLSSGYYNDTLKMLETCTTVIVPFLNNDNSLQKMRVFAKEIEGHDTLYTLSNKMIAVENCSSSKSIDAFGNIDVRACIPVTNTMRSVQDVLGSNDRNSIKQLMRLFAL